MTFDDDYSDYYDDENEAEERPAPFVKGSATSEQAARTLTTRGKHAEMILGLFLGGGTFTRDEVVTRINEGRRLASEREIVYSSATARMTELSQAGCLEPTGETRITGHGRRPAEVLRLVPGATLETFLRWKDGRKKTEDRRLPAMTLGAWRNALEHAARLYQVDQRRETLEALGAVALRRPR